MKNKRKCPACNHTLIVTIEGMKCVFCGYVNKQHKLKGGKSETTN